MQRILNYTLFRLIAIAINRFGDCFMVYSTSIMTLYVVSVSVTVVMCVYA